ncbi:MAG: response regulator [Oscillospiraceae bacterium]
MHTITVDDESLAVSAMLRVLKKKDPNGTHFGTVRVGEFLEYIRSHPDIDIAFIDVEMKTDGITLTKKIKQITKNLNIVIYSGHPQYKADALDQHVSSFISKPVTEEKLQIALDNLRFPLKNGTPEESSALTPLKVTTFGNFVVYDKNGDVMKFTSRHAQAILAYLIDQCGYPATPKDVAAVVFEIEEYDNYASKRVSRYISELRNDLENAGYGDVVIKESRTVKINKKRISCDLYDALQGDKATLATFHNEYMLDYSWAEKSESFRDLEEMHNQLCS